MSVPITACDLQEDLDLSCQDFAVGGIQARIYIANWKDIKSFTPDTTYPDGAVSEITFVDGGQKFFIVGLLENSSGYDFALQGMKGAGSLNFAQGVNFTIPGMNAQKLQAARIFARGKFVAIVQARYKNTPDTGNDSELRTFLIGMPNGLTVETETGGLGVAQADQVGSIFRISDAQDNGGYEIIPNPATYPGPTPIYDFIQAHLQNPAV